MTPALRKKSVRIAGHSTSLTLEPEFWDVLSRLAAAQGKTTAEMIAAIDRGRSGNLSSAVRVYILKSLLSG